jgi:acetyl esterase/lipase
MTAIYRGMDRATLDAAYDNTGAVADSQDYRAHWWEASAAIRAQPQSKLDVRYGARPRAALDYFPSGATHAPLFVFIHGGYWQRNEKERFSFIVPGPRAHGINVAIPGYTLAPDARLTDIVAEIRQALSFLANRADDLGFDRSTSISAAGRPEDTSRRWSSTIQPCAAQFRSAAFSTSSRSRSASSMRSFGLAPRRSQSSAR